MSTPIIARVRAVGKDMDELGAPPGGHVFVCIEVPNEHAGLCHDDNVALTSERGWGATDAYALKAAREHEAQARAVCVRRTAELEAVSRTLASARAEVESLRTQLADAHAPAPKPVNRGQTYVILGEVVDERRRRDAKWGEQNHPSFRPGMSYEAFDEADAKRLCEERAKAGNVAYADILAEEFHEVIGTNNSTLGREHDNDDHTRAEAVQLAAVAVAMIEAIDRRKAGVVS